MIVRALDTNHDWTFGKSKSDYLSGLDAIAQNIDTRLYMFLGDCFFATDAGIDWFNLLGVNKELAISLAVSSTILNTDQVTGIVQLSITVDAARQVTIQYQVQTTQGTLANEFIFSTAGI